MSFQAAKPVAIPARAKVVIWARLPSQHDHQEFATHVSHQRHIHFFHDVKAKHIYNKIANAEPRSQRMSLSFPASKAEYDAFHEVLKTELS